MYDPKQKKIHYCGHSYVPVTSKLSDIIPLLNDRAGFAPDTELLLYEEIRPNMIEKINNFNEPIEKVSVLCRVFFCGSFVISFGLFQILEELMDGDIIIFEKDEGDVNSDLPTCIDYYKDLFYRVEVTFVDKTIPNDQGMCIYFLVQFCAAWF